MGALLWGGEGGQGLPVPSLLAPQPVCGVVGAQTLHEVEAAGESCQLLITCHQAGICICVKHFNGVHSFTFLRSHGFYQ